MAKATLEHVHDVCGSRTLFATHFGGLRTMQDERSSVALYHAEAYVDDGRRRGDTDGGDGDDDYGDGGKNVCYTYRIIPGW